ncbi:DUF1003 domain-containing protein [Taibaiella chishuiensis]|uniref:Putative membrane protein n=1 Tax=Taibaiella chishuiensis TaxID=1434707 RepID=A0A2P8CZ87_9BACT|nr:DUF1003 domain-containing protein [Taibaiella chishuiensis]PSK90279.1 putative membrane protein [Taibaiella chishuiensis]
METFISGLSGKEFPVSERVSGNVIHGELLKIIQKENPDFGADDHLSVSELNSCKLKYLSDHLMREVGDLGEMEQTVLDSIGKRNSITAKLDDDDLQSTLGQRVADKVAAFGGSWKFIIFFSITIVVWILGNVYMLHNKGFDPYPFILLNLILSCLAALQAPVIMMSQNRQEEKDRQRAKSDYMINLKSELEIRMLHEKLDHLIIRQQEDIIEIQRSQLEQMNNMIARLEDKKG